MQKKACFLGLILGFSILAGNGYCQDVPVSSISPIPGTEQPPKKSKTVVLIIKAKGTGKALSRAEVMVGKQLFYSDPQGKVSITVPSEGEGKISVSRHKYERQFFDFADLRKVDSQEIFLFPGKPDDNEVYIRGVKRPSVSRKTISADESTRVAPGGDVVQVTKLMPGVQTAAFRPEVVIRGSGPYDSVYYVDNIEVPMVFHQMGQISIIPEQLISDVEFSAGGFGPQYGEATGGVITLRTKSDIPEDPKTEFKVNLPMYSAIYHERPLGEDKSLAVSIRRSYLDQLLPLAMKGQDMTVIPYFGDAHAFYLQKTPDGGSWKVLGIGSSDGIKLVSKFDGSSAEDGKAKIKAESSFAQFGVERLQPLSGGWSYTATPQFGYNRVREEILDNTLNIDLTSASLRLELSKKLGKKEFFYIGIDPVWYQAKLDLKIPIPNGDPFWDWEEAPQEERKETLSGSFFASWASIDYQLGDLILTPGFRYFYNDFVKKSGYDPRLNARYELTPSSALKGAVGQYSKSPDFLQVDKQYGNPSLDYLRSVHYVLGLETRWSDRWETDLQLYQKRTYHVVSTDPETKYDNDGSWTSRGFEVFVRRNLTEKFFGWLSYTYSETKERESAEKPLRRTQYDQTHVGTFAGSYKLNAIWDCGWRLLYHTGDTYTPKSNVFYHANLDKYQVRTPDEDLNSGRLPPYHQLDLFATREFLFDTWKMALRFGIEYLALRRQVFGKSYNYDYSEEQDVNFVPPIPFIEVKGVL